jgi:hypothetical protein
MSRRKPKPSFGSISTGTLRTEDLLEAFLAELNYLGQGKLAKKLERELTDGAAAIAELNDDVPDDYAEYILSDAQDALAELALPYQYFGTLEGDGADFGFWFDRHAFDEDSSGSAPLILQLAAGDRWPKPVPRLA